MSVDGKYQKQNLIGSGERVDVFLGLNVAFDRKVAIKELRGGVETSDTERTAFYSEYEKWAKLEHLRIAHIADIDRTRAWVILEYLPKSILDRSDELSSDPSLAYTAAEQLFEGLAYLHGKGLMHCNLKASNVRFSDDGLKLTDGRCVQIGYPGSLPKPRGSNRYLAPEMINEEFGNVGTASDIYVAGIVLLETLAGPKFESLFQGYVSGTPDVEMGWVRWHNSTDQLEPIHSQVPSIPKPLANLLDGMLCKEVRVRHASAERLLQELRAAKEEVLSAPAISPTAATAAKSKGDKPSAAPDGKAKEQQVKLIDRPSSPVYVRLLSGPLAGSIYPLSMGEVTIGEAPGCNVRLSPEQYPAIHGRQIKIVLGTNGWQISDPQGHPVFVDLKKSFDAAPIRSGSIFRLTPRGPDFQFVVQGEHDWTWQDISSQLKLMTPETHSVPDRLLKDKKKPDAAAAKAPATKPAPAASPAPARPSPPTPQSKSAKAQKAKQAEKAKAKAEKAKAKSKPAAPANPAPAKPDPPKPVAEKKEAAPVAAAVAAAPNAPARPDSAPGPPGTTEAKSSEKQSLGDKFKNMDTSKRNNLILLVGLPIIAILIILFMPRSGSNEPEKKPDQGNQAAVENESTEPSGENSGDDSSGTSGTSDTPAVGDSSGDAGSGLGIGVKKDGDG